MHFPVVAVLRPHLLQLLLLATVTLSQPVASQQVAPWVGERLDGDSCIGGEPTNGPYDYLNQQQHRATLKVVEEFHFTEGVQNLTQGASSSPMGDLDFVLRAFPNHHGALRSVTVFSIAHDKHPAGEKGLPAECYLQRAMAFSPWDPVPPKLYGYYLHRKGKLDEALVLNRDAMQRAPGDAMLQYNTALLLVDMERWDEAMELARPLYDAGLTMPGLRNKLIKADQWDFTDDERERWAHLIPDQSATESAAAQVQPDTTDEAPDVSASSEVSAGGVGDEQRVEPPVPGEQP